MFVGTLLTDDGRRVSNPSWEDIAAAIRSLHRGGIILEARLIENCNLVVDAGDGRDGRFVVQVWMSNGLFYYLTDPSRIEGETPRVVGEQEIPWPSQWTHDRDAVLLASECFARRGDLDSRLKWEIGG